MKKAIFILALLPFVLYGQSGGSYTFQSLNLMNSARTAALGGYNVSTVGDLATFSQNPAILDSVRSGDIAFMYNPFFVDINALTLQYASEIGQLGSFGFGLTYINYGDFEGLDDTGVEQGTFTAQDYVFTIGHAHRVGPFVLGMNAKYIHSGIAGYSANALAFDVGGIYQLENSGFTAGVVISNIGIILTDYIGESPEIPVRVSAGMTFKPIGMPIRFTLTGHNFIDQGDEFFDSNDEPNFADEILRRLSIGGEVFFSKNVNFLLGYDHHRKRELRLDATGGGAGFSYGLMIRIRKYEFRFSRAIYQAAGGTSFISLQSNLKDAKKIF